MIKLVKKNISLVGIGYTRSFSGNRFKHPKSVQRTNKLEKLKKEESAEFQLNKAEVERFRSDFWRKHDKKYYFGAHTFILYKQDQDERKELINEEINYEEQNIMKVKQLGKETEESN